MNKFHIVISIGLIGIFLLPIGCDTKDKWKAVPLKITKRESFNYSEMISGNLDSTEKAELEAAKEKTAQEIKDKPDRLSGSPTKSKTEDSSTLGSIWRGVQNFYNWFLDLF